MARCHWRPHCRRIERVSGEGSSGGVPHHAPEDPAGDKRKEITKALNKAIDILHVKPLPQMVSMRMAIEPLQIYIEKRLEIASDK